MECRADKCYASEVDKFAIKATMQNFPDTIQLGDVRELDVISHILKGFKRLKNEPNS